MIYYLQQHEKKGRLIIDGGFPQSAHKVFDSRHASSWIEAKKAFGFELTAVQQVLLDQQRKRKYEACAA